MPNQPLTMISSDNDDPRPWMPPNAIGALQIRFETAVDQCTVFKLTSADDDPGDAAHLGRTCNQEKKESAGVDKLREDADQ